MAVHLNALFLVYVAVLGLSTYAVAFTAPALIAGDRSFPEGGRRSLAAWTLIGTGALFAVLWLSELVPALLAGQVPASLAEADLGVNPIHVIDLAVVLPGFILAGVASLQGRRHGLFWLAPWLAFSVLMGASIVAAMLLIAAAGYPGTLPPTVMVCAVVAASAIALWRSLRSV